MEILFKNLIKPERGHLNFTITFADAAPNASFVIYRDFENNSFSHIWKNRKQMTCWEKVALADRVVPLVNNQSHSIPFKEINLVHFWYFFIVNCDSYAINVHIDATAVNPEGLWKRQFSVELQGIL